MSLRLKLAPQKPVWWIPTLELTPTGYVASAPSLGSLLEAEAKSKREAINELIDGLVREYIGLREVTDAERAHLRAIALDNLRFLLDGEDARWAKATLKSLREMQ